ncbi:hypothetical protein, partial [Fulvivirga kasyanovii]|uniref:hypothetical protein n=1 Tax=Fulvivirga kasyanovii TaxID=396812 RepID=UPI0016258974
TDSTVSEDRRPEIKDHKPAPTFSLVDISKFPYKQLDSTYFDWELYKTLPLITEFVNNGYGEGRYYSDQTFSDNFNSYIFAVLEGGDCGPGLWLVNCKGDEVLSQHTLFDECGWENGSHVSSTSFLNDSTFKVTTNAQGKMQDKEGNYIIDSLTIRIYSRTYFISSEGKIEQIDESDTTWNKLKN